MIKLFLAIVVLMMSYACENTEETDVFNADVYQGFRFGYDEGSNQTSIGAVFRLGSIEGEKIELLPPAYLKVNEECCVEYDEESEYPYGFTFESRVPVAVIDFADFKKRMFIHSIKLDSLVYVGELSVEKERGEEKINILFTGEKQSSKETITVVVMYEDNEVSFEADAEDDNTISLGSDVVAMFVGKEVGIKILRVKNIKLDNVSAAGGDLQLVYTSRVKWIQL